MVGVGECRYKSLPVGIAGSRQPRPGETRRVEVVIVQPAGTCRILVFREAGVGGVYFSESLPPAEAGGIRLGDVGTITRVPADRLWPDRWALTREEACRG